MDLLLSFIFLTVVLFKHINCDILVYPQFTNQIMAEFHDMPARFGPSFPSPNLRAVAIHGSPPNGCIDMKPAPYINDTRLLKSVVLIARYNCSFEDKVRNAQKAGYDAVIVYNIGSDDLETMSAKDANDIMIPSMFVGELTGQMIIYNYLYEDGYILVLNDEFPFNINTHLILPFSIVVGLCFIIMIAFMVIKCIREQRRQRRHRLPSSVLRKIPIIKFSKGDSYETCAICLDDYIEGERLRVLPCAHAYHSKCIDPWLTKNRRVCPICKRKVFARGERRQRRSSSDSMSSSDADDRTPLLNPVGNTQQLTNHGTFTRTEQDNTNQQRTGGNRNNRRANRAERQSNRTDATSASPDVTTQRINPFDRVPNLPPQVQQSLSQSSSGNRWNFIFKFFRRQLSPDLSNEAVSPEVNVVIDGVGRNAPQPPAPTNTESVSVVLPSRAASSTSSNNILNTNLSGSFKNDNDTDSDNHVTRVGADATFNYKNEQKRRQARQARRSAILHGTTSANESSNGDVPPPSRRSSTGDSETRNSQYARRNRTETERNTGRIGVVALPNTNFQPSSSPPRRQSSRSHFNI